MCRSVSAHLIVCLSKLPSANVSPQIAIARLYDGEPVEPVDPVPPPRSIHRQETLLNGIPPVSLSSERSGLEPAPRVVAQPENHSTYDAPFLIQLALLPFNLFYGVLSKTLGLFSYLFPFLPRLLGRLSGRTGSRASRRTTSGRRPLQPRDTAARFIRELEEQYGGAIAQLPFAESSYAEAYDKAKRELKFLVVVLLSLEHDDTASFVRDTLASPEAVAFLANPQNNMLLWAGNVQDAEAYQVANQLNCTKFPFVGLIVHTPSVSSMAMSVVLRLAGPTPPATFVAKIQTTVNQHANALSTARAQRAEQQAARDLRESQNDAYERSLAQDRERARRKREAEEARKRAEQEAEAKAQAAAQQAKLLEQWRQWRANSIETEPATGTGAVRISVRLPTGVRLTRSFRPDAPIEEVYALVECHELLKDGVSEGGAAVQKPAGFEHSYKFQLVSPMPREVYDLAKGGTVKERIGRSGNLIVERLVDDDDEDDEDEDEE